MRLWQVTLVLWRASLYDCFMDNESIPAERLEALFEGSQLQINESRIRVVNRAWRQASSEARAFFKLHVHVAGTPMRHVRPFVNESTPHREGTAIKIGRGLDRVGNFSDLPNKQFEVWLTWNRVDFHG